MKATTKLLLAAATVAVVFSTGTLNASPRSDQFLGELKTSGAVPGDKIDRTVKAISPRAADLATSYAKVGSAPGDKLDRTMHAMSPKVHERMSVRIAPAK